MSMKLRVRDTAVSLQRIFKFVILIKYCVIVGLYGDEQLAQLLLRKLTLLT